MMPAALLQDLRVSVRSLSRSPGFVLAAVVTLALGIGANSAIFSVVDALLLKPLPYADADRLVLVTDNFLKLGMTTMSASVPEYLEWRERARSFGDIAAYVFGSFNVAGAQEPEHVRGVYVVGPLQRTLGASPALGRDLLPEEEQPGHTRVVLLSHGLWKRRFGGDPDLPGRQVTIDAESYTVAGVLPEGAGYPPGADLWVPLAMTPERTSNNERGSRFLRVVARLAPGATVESAQAEMSLLARRTQEEHPGAYTADSGWEITVQSLRDRLVGPIRPALLLLFGAVGLVLLIACANIAGLMISRGAGRRREIAIRAALGAGRGRLVLQHLAESTALALAGGAAGLLLGMWGIDLLMAAAPPGASSVARIQLDGRVVAFTLAASLLAGILSGLGPALLLSAGDLAQKLREGSGAAGGAPRRRRLHGALVVGEIAVALVVLAGAGLMLRSFRSLVAVDAGFDPTGVLTMQVTLPPAKYASPPEVLAFHAQALERIRSMPEVTAAGAVTIIPLCGSNSSSSYTVEEHPSPKGTNPPEADRRAATPGYFQAMGIPILRGRDFTPGDDGPPSVAIVDDLLARVSWPGEEPIGKRLKIGWPESDAPWLEVVGVVRHVRNEDLTQEGRGEIYLPATQYLTQREMGARSIATMYLVARTAGDAAALAPGIRSIVRAIDAQVPLADLRPMPRVLASSIAPQRASALFFGIFGTIALALATVGVYGLIAFNVEQRTKEIGVRISLGATPWDVVRMVLRQGLVSAAIGVSIGLAGALGASRLMRRILFEVSPSDPATFLSAVALLIGVAMAACWIPARRAARVDPILALRSE